MWVRAAEAIASARTLHLSAGAGMGVDSGLPDFRGPEGFWSAYPAFRHLGLDFMDLANPRWFAEDPPLAWGFYGHRLLLYRETEPHGGYDILRRWGETRTTTVFTSNVDGAFARAGFDPDGLYEVHGSIHHLQCATPCRRDIWPCEVSMTVDLETCRATSSLPRCPSCGGLARPNILMFGDWSYVGDRGDRQAGRYLVRARRSPEPAVVIECGAGSAVPTVRVHSEDLQRRGATLIRINPREAHGPPGTLSLDAGALEALTRLDALISG